MNTILYLAIAAVGAAVLYLIYAYNRLVVYINRAEEAWADIDVQLKRRYDLIPNLVNTVKGYAQHEREAFENVTAARERAMQAEGAAEHSEADGELSKALKSIFAIAEAYPDLKASENFAELQRELADTENKIQAARRFYNTNVRDLQNALESFPTNYIGSLFGFQTRDFFELDNTEAREPVEVQF